jgi:acyl-CoA synthetase (NDP forming)
MDNSVAMNRNSPEIFFTFKSVVIVGASDDPTRIGGLPIVLLKKYGFEGKIYGLNPKYKSVQGCPCFAEPEDLPGSVDVAIFCLAGEMLKIMLPRLKRKGLKGAVIFSSGFSESGEDGKALQAWLSAYARDNGVSVVGPNCVGQISFAANRALTFANPMLVFPRGETGRIALLSQSGGVAGNIWADAVLGGARFSHKLTTGNEADLSFADFLEYLADDPNTDAVLGYIEGLHEGQAFCAAADRLRKKNKPLVLMRVGRSAMGEDTISSHTGQMSSPDAGYQAAFDRYDVIRAATLQELNDHARLLSLDGLRPKLTVATTSGGIAVYTADLCAEHGVELSGLSRETETALEQFVPSFGRVRNPVDLTAQVVNDAAILEKSIRVLLDDPETGVLLFLLSGKGSKEQSQQVIDLFLKIQAETPKKIVLCWTSIQAEVRQRAISAGLIVYQDPANFIRPLGDYFRYQAMAADAPKEPSRDTAPAALTKADLASVAEALVPNESGRKVFPENAALDLLASVGVDCPRRWRVRTQANFDSALAEIVYPCVMKISEPVIAHKSDVGGVVLGISSAQELRDAWQSMQSGLGAQEVLIVEEIERGVEVLVGCLRDATFGMRLSIGAGGIWTNMMKDSVTLIPPFDAEYIRRSLERLTIWGALSGGRGQGPANVEELVKTVAQIAAAGSALFGHLSEFECNPVIVTQDRAVVVDAIGFG